ncbi:hypothetical protein EJ07DRAFT_160481 [Lizonia empirigonia]|nr:hypothetical protein EJ07DRAFT_160481 [Lizonia empirigonia]
MHNIILASEGCSRKTLSMNAKTVQEGHVESSTSLTRSSAAITTVAASILAEMSAATGGGYIVNTEVTIWCSSAADDGYGDWAPVSSLAYSVVSSSFVVDTIISTATETLDVSTDHYTVVTVTTDRDAYPTIIPPSSSPNVRTTTAGDDNAVSTTQISFQSSVQSSLTGSSLSVSTPSNRITSETYSSYLVTASSDQEWSSILQPLTESSIDSTILTERSTQPTSWSGVSHYTSDVRRPQPMC